MVKQAAHDSSDECSNHSSLNILINKYNNNNKKKVRMLELVDSANLSFADISRERSSRSSDKYLNDPSLTNKTNQNYEQYSNIGYSTVTIAPSYGKVDLLNSKYVKRRRIK